MICILFSNYNGSTNGFLKPFLESLNKNLNLIKSKELAARVIIIDAASTDNSLEIIKEFIDTVGTDTVEVLKTERIEVTESTNHGIQHIFDKLPECQIIVTLDIDTILSNNFIVTLVEKEKSASRNIGMFASNQFMLSEYPLKKTHRCTGHNITPAGATYDRDFKKTGILENKDVLCSCLSGSLLRSEMLNQIGLIPNEYLHYYNCPEQGFRAQLKGWCVEFVEDAIMWHNYRKQTKLSSELKENREVTRIWNVLRFFPKNRIESALEEYKLENFKTSPSISEKNRYIEKAKKTVSLFTCDFPEEEKQELFKKFVYSRTRAI